MPLCESNFAPGMIQFQTGIEERLGSFENYLSQKCRSYRTQPGSNRSKNQYQVLQTLKIVISLSLLAKQLGPSFYQKLLIHPDEDV